MNFSPELLLIGAVAGVGVLHTIVPDHWVPITLIARQRGWSKAETARASFQAGIGHVVSTLLIAAVVWLAGVAVATRFGHVVDTLASLALIGFGGWIAISSWWEMRGQGRGHGHRHGHGHGHSHDFSHLGADEEAANRNPVHGPELQRIDTGHGIILLSIFEAGVPPRFRVTGVSSGGLKVETLREGGTRQTFLFANHGTYWESIETIPEPHGFKVILETGHGDHTHTYETAFADHDHGHGDHDHGGHAHGDEPALADDRLYVPSRGETLELVRHIHAHRHGNGVPHLHWHDHAPATAHSVAGGIEANPPLHEHKHKTSARTALLLILGSSPMVEGIPAFFAAGKYGIGLIIAMALVFAISTIATYVLLCVYSIASLQRVRLGAFERYGEVLSGAFIALVGLAFWIWPVI